MFPSKYLSAFLRGRSSWDFAVAEYTDSDALNDHHAFTFFAQHGILGIPMQTTLTAENNENNDVWWPGQQVNESALRLFKIDANAEEGITDLGSLSQMDMWEELTTNIDSTFWNISCHPVRRSVIISDDSGVFVYGLSHLGASVGQVTDTGVTALTSVYFGYEQDEEFNCGTNGGL